MHRSWSGWVASVWTVVLAASVQAQDTTFGESGRRVEWKKLGPMPGAGTQVLDFSSCATDPDRVYAGGLGGALVSDDGGASWVARRVPFSPHTFSYVACSPADPDVVLAGTWHGEVFRSVDAGRNWQLVHLDPDAQDELSLNWQPTFAPSNSNIAYLMSYDEILRSDDGGVSFTPLLEGLVDVGGLAHDLAVDSFDPDHAYFLVAGLGVYETTDGGTTWNVRHPPSLTGFDLDIDPHDASRIMIAGAGVSLSEDGGLTWTESFPGGGGLADCVAFDPSDPDRLFVGLREGALMVSNDAGLSWNLITSTELDRFGQNFLALNIHPSRPSHVLSGGSGGIVRSTDAGATFQPSNQGLDHHAFVKELAASPSDHRNLVARTGNWAYWTTDGGQSWSACDAPAPFTRTWPSLSADPLVPGRFYAGTGATGFVCRSDDHGATFTPTHSTSFDHDVGLIEGHPTVPHRIFVGVKSGGSGLQRSDDAGVSFGPTGYPNSRVTALALSPSRPNWMYVGNWRKVYSSSDGGATFTRFDSDEMESVRDISIHPTRPKHAVAACDGGLYFTVDGGQSWVKGGDQRDIFSVVMSRNNPREWLTASLFDHPVLRTVDRGEHFGRVGGGIPSAVWVVRESRDGRIRWAGTGADGVMFLRND